MPKTLALLAAAVVAAAPARAEIVLDGSARTAPAPERDPRPALCATYEIHARYLASRYGESPLFTGQAGAGITLQIFLNRATGSWTALLVRADGFSCVTGMGENGRQDAGL